MSPFDCVAIAPELLPVRSACLGVGLASIRGTFECIVVDGEFVGVTSSSIDVASELIGVASESIEGTSGRIGIAGESIEVTSWSNEVTSACVVVIST